MEFKVCGLIKTISFSALQDWKFCPHYYKLVVIDKLRPFTKNVWTVYGGLLHKYVQEVLINNSIDPIVSAKKFERVWNKFCGIYKTVIVKDLKENVDPKMFSISGMNIISNIREKFQEQFGEFKVLQIEEWLRCKCFEEYPQDFVGCIDIAIELKNGNVVVADFKSCESDYKFNQFKDRFKEYQLTLYKHFYSLKHNVNLNNIETFFITMERNPKSKNPLKFHRISSGPKKIKNAIEWLETSLGGINGGFFIKNRMSCHKYGENHACAFYKSEFCK